MAKQKAHKDLVKQIRKRYGSAIDLKKSPSVLIEILRNYGRLVFDDDDGGGGTSTVAVGITPGTGGGGGTGSGGTGSGGTGSGGTGSGGTSTVAVGITPPEIDFGEHVSNADILKTVLKIQRDVKMIGKSIGKRAKR